MENNQEKLELMKICNYINHANNSTLIEELALIRGYADIFKAAFKNYSGAKKPEEKYKKSLEQDMLDVYKRIFTFYNSLDISILDDNDSDFKPAIQTKKIVCGNNKKEGLGLKITRLANSSNKEEIIIRYDDLSDSLDEIEELNIIPYSARIESLEVELAIKE